MRRSVSSKKRTAARHTHPRAEHPLAANCTQRGKKNDARVNMGQEQSTEATTTDQNAPAAQPSNTSPKSEAVYAMSSSATTAEKENDSVPPAAEQLKVKPAGVIQTGTSPTSRPQRARKNSFAIMLPDGTYEVYGGKDANSIAVTTEQSNSPFSAREGDRGGSLPRPTRLGA